MDPELNQGTCYGFQIQSAFQFRYLRAGDGPTLRVVSSAQRGLGPADRLLQTWTPRAPNQQESYLYDNGRTYRLCMGKSNWFEVDPLASVIAAPHCGNPLRLEQHVWGIPSALCFINRGDLALHAAAVEVERSALLLAAPGGFGKSTLGAAFLSAGHRLLSEDLSCVRPGAPSVIPGPAMLRLRRDVVQRLDAGPARAVRETRDRITYAVPPMLRGDCAPVSLRGIVLLFTSPGETRFERVPTEQAISALWALSLQIPTEAHQQRVFTGIVQLASQVPVWNLHRTLNIRNLPEMVERISATCLGGSPAHGRPSP